MDVLKTMRIVILGKTGSGKSSLANTIFGEELFTIDHTINSETGICRAETKSVTGRNITVIDTPGFFDTDRSEEELKPEIVRCIIECAPGPHAFLIVLKVEKYTEHEKAVVTKICEYFSEEVFKYATLVFTHGDQLNGEQTIEDWVCENKVMSDLVQKCGGRCHVIDNKYWNNAADGYRSNQFQVEELLKTIDRTLLANNGGCYTNEVLQAVEAEIQQEEEQIRQSSGNMSEGERRRQAINQAFKKLMIKLAGTATGALLGALLGVVVLVGVVCKILKSSLESIQLRQAVATAAAAAVGGGTFGLTRGTTGAAAAAAAGVVGTSLTIVTGTAIAAAGVGAIKGGLTGYNAAEGADTPQEAAKLAAKAVKDEAQSYLDKANDRVDSLLTAKVKKDQ